MQREDLENDFPFFVPDSIFGIELARNLYEEFGDMIRLNGNDKASRRRFGSFLNNIKTVYTTAMHETKSTYDREIATMAKVISNKDVEIAELQTGKKLWNERLAEKRRTIESQNITILELRKRTEPERFEGTITKVENWKKTENASYFSKDAPIPANSCPLHATAQRKCREFGNKVFSNENDMYTPVRTFLRSLLDKAQYRVFDTHANDFLNNRKPDITISSAVLRDPHPIYVTTLIELKATTKDIDAKAMGQGLDYLERLVSSQPQRQQFTILISNLHCNRFIQYSRGGFGSQHKITSFSPCDFVTAMQFLNDIVHDHNEQPEIPQFSPGLGVMQAHLGSTAYNIVASFRTPSETLPAMSWVSHIPFFDSLDLIAVKRRRRAPQAPEDTLAREIGLLKLIANVKHLPTILFHNSTFTEYAATPVGRPADPKYLNNHSSLSQQILTDVLTALIYLHENNIIHRDLRWDNIVEYEGRGYLIDLGSAVPASPRIEQKYFGGYICCPPRIAGSINTPYTPEKADDYHAYVLLVNTMLFPASTRGFNSVRLEDPTSDESKRFGSFWRRLKRSVVWGRYVTAAETGDVQLLGQMPEMVVMMESCEEPGDLTIQPEWEEIGTEGEEEGESAEEGVGAVPLLEEFEKLMRERGTDEGKEVD